MKIKDNFRVRRAGEESCDRIVKFFKKGVNSKICCFLKHFEGFENKKKKEEKIDQKVEKIDQKVEKIDQKK